MQMVTFDTETTGLLAPIAAGSEHQPYLVEFYGIKTNYEMDENLNHTFRIVDTLTFRCKPPIPIPEDAIKVHHITNDDVKDCRSFANHFVVLAEFFLGAELCIGHNLRFDQMVLYWELFRLDKALNFPWPYKNVCTAEISSQQKGFRQNLTDLHTELFGMAFTGSHSASNDCEATMKCFVELVNRGRISI